MFLRRVDAMLRLRHWFTDADVADVAQPNAKDAVAGHLNRQP
jgi:hypothetical protein